MKHHSLLGFILGGATLILGLSAQAQMLVCFPGTQGIAVTGSSVSCEIDFPPPGAPDALLRADNSIPIFLNNTNINNMNMSLRMQLRMQHDGNLVLYDGNMKSLWATSLFQDSDTNGFSGPTYGLLCETCVAAFKSNGNLVLYRNVDSLGRGINPYWATSTVLGETSSTPIGPTKMSMVITIPVPPPPGTGASTAQIPNSVSTTPNVQLLANGSPVWGSNCSNGSCTDIRSASVTRVAPSVNARYLMAGQTINTTTGAGDNFILQMQNDRNLVIYKNGKGVWATSFFPQNDVNGFTGPTYDPKLCPGCYAEFRTDGKLILFNAQNEPYWQISIAGSSPFVSGTTTLLNVTIPSMTSADGIVETFKFNFLSPTQNPTPARSGTY